MSRTSIRPAAWVTVVACGIVTTPAFGFQGGVTVGSGRVTFDKDGTVSADGRHATVSGRADCEPADGALSVSVSLLQTDSMAVGRGFTSGPQQCSDKVDTFKIEVTA